MIYDPNLPLDKQDIDDFEFEEEEEDVDNLCIKNT
jgi:hypothetical protein